MGGILITDLDFDDCSHHRGPTQSLFLADCYFIVPLRNSQRRTQTPSKSLKKPLLSQRGRLYTTGKVIQRLFIIDLYT